MRSLSNTLLKAQRSGSHLPYIKVEVIDRIAGIAKPHWERLYQGSEPDFYHAATIPSDGSLIRARVGSGNHRLYRQRVIDPGPGSDFATWLEMEQVSSTSDIALASQGAMVLLFYVGADQRTIYYRESTNYGADFSSAEAILTTAAAVEWLAADFSYSGVVALFYSVGSTIYVIKRADGSWGSPAAWTNSLSSISGIACYYEGDWNLIVSGSDAEDEKGVWTYVYGDGYSQSPGTCSALAELTVASAGSDVEFRCPSLSFPDVFRACFIEEYSGASPYSRPFCCHSLASAEFISNLWREPVPFNLSSNYGLALTYHGGYVWLSCPFGVWRARLSPASVDLSQDVIELNISAEPFSGGAQIELRNDDGRYKNIETGDYAAISQGSEVLLSPGYHTEAGVEVSPGLSYWIAGWEYVSTGGQATFILYAEDGWGLLQHWRARRQFSWSAGSKNIFQLLAFIFARAGLEFSAFSYSDLLVNHYPSFTIHPGESGALAVRHLLEMVPDVLFFRRHYGYIVNPKASDASVYSYGTEHSLWQGQYRRSPLSANHIQVFGAAVLSEGFDWTGIEKVYDRLHQVYDLNLDTVEKAQKRAEAELRQQEIAASNGKILVPVNCGQELYDVIDITDSRAGLEAERRRVLGLSLRYSTKEGRYEQRLSLGGV